jgi:hypothetical protein
MADGAAAHRAGHDLVAGVELGRDEAVDAVAEAAWRLFPPFRSSVRANWSQSFCATLKRKASASSRIG